MLRSKKVARQRFLCVPIEQFFFFRVTFCPTILHPITSFLFLSLVLLACMMLSFLFLALFVFRADLCVFFFCSVSIRVCIYVLCGFVTSKRVFLRVFSLGCCCCYCCCCCVFLATIHCFTFHYGFFFHCVLCLISLLHRYDTSRCQLYYGGHKGGGAGVSTTRRGRPAAYITSHCMFFHLFYTLVRSIFSPTYFFLALAFFPFSPSISFFSKKKSKKLVHSRLSRT